MSTYACTGASALSNMPYDEWVKIQNASDGSDHAVTPSAVTPSAVTPSAVTPSADIVITETLVHDSRTTEMRVVFARNGSKYKWTYEAKMLNHSYTSKIDNWTKRIDAIVEGKAIRSLDTPTYWTDESRLTFLKVACLCNRVDDVQKVFECSTDILDAAHAWAHRHGVVYVRTWMHSDEITVRDHKLKFTLQKWSDGSHITCVQQLITGNDRTTIEELSTILRDIIGSYYDNHCAHAQYSDVYARAAIFADAVSTYKLLLNRSSEDLALAKKYESKRMIEHLAPRVQEWTVSNLAVTGAYYTLTKKDGVVTCAQLTDTVAQVINNRIDLYNIQGGPQMWAEIAAFADNAQSLTTAKNFASTLGVCLDNKRIGDALAAGKMVR